MDNPLELSDRIRLRILDRHLPSHPDARIFTGAGDGQICGCCDRAVGHYELQIDVEHPARVSNPVVAMHRSCFQLWSRMAEELEGDGQMNGGASRTPRQPAAQFDEAV